MSIGTFIIIKNEAEYVGYSIMSVLDYVDEMVFYDGNSTDGTLEIIEYIKKKYDKDNKIKVFLDKDCKDLKDDYVRLFNDCIGEVKSQYAWFLHPDMICLNPEMIRTSINSELRYSVLMASVAGENRDKLITKGRGRRWASIFRNSLGLHYFGHYGAFEEDCYFRDITGDEHIFYDVNPRLPYTIKHTNIKLVHFCDCKPYERRYGRMVECLKNQFKNADGVDIEQTAKVHPRVTLESGTIMGHEFKFEDWPHKLDIFEKYKDEFEPLRKV